MVNVFLCRHGEASFDAPSDRLRPLTEMGKSSTKQRASEMKSLLTGVVTEIWSSDLLRAQQTAEFFADSLKMDVTVQTFLRPDSDPALVVKKLAECSENDCILVVAHMPLLGDLVSLLREGNFFTPYNFQTSEVVHLHGELAAAGLMERVALS
ncbi:hypothetical protein A3742_02995 [Oleiphilus sp. HI0071]|uniref:phosphohistidine phosphatase SixA n=1 Tax=Oleiphilus sp. HI0080 TaxID=1822255 RepID=UPI0007C346E1|nr:phosphohistidine phosphatase SixA [Oleiphilus sp. HI0080]KZY61057.1 hypothetical protein A3737_06225 [Oleiphilus sp. HI0065]KZY89729.1 hypothetical protein A3744_06145 [Oleiphilus sp. HI0073]KZY90281.1 hypothetical protein A3742_02995 [Oleiphilus sp. HI0071]KZZ46437.1 hypothetical protein A3758_14065 [Oleiphilus sp. HI0118]KZZ48673.1 hypothetical protein A3760_23020 [Oleiphilus sp. HI0122]KZZ78605.1 hypothetical protein A3767_18050 [Oleiphilus sp. HI0133]